MITTESPSVRQLLRDRDALMFEAQEMERRKVNPYRPFHDVMRDGAWAGERCFIVGGGPSLRGFDFERLRGQGRVIVINKAFLDVPFADVLFFMDYTSFYQRLYRGELGLETLQRWREFEGHKVFLNIMGYRVEDAYSVRSSDSVGLSNSLKHGIYHGNNSGVGALGLAIILKANPIYLLGIDCKHAGGESHYHGGYGKLVSESIIKSFARNFERLNRFIERTGFKIMNLNPASGCRCFEFSTVDEVLND